MNVGLLNPAFFHSLTTYSEELSPLHVPDIFNDITNAFCGLTTNTGLLLISSDSSNFPLFNLHSRLAIRDILRHLYILFHLPLRNQVQNVLLKPSC